MVARQITGRPYGAIWTLTNYILQTGRPYGADMANVILPEIIQVDLSPADPDSYRERRRRRKSAEIPAGFGDRMQAIKSRTA